MLISVKENTSWGNTHCRKLPVFRVRCPHYGTGECKGEKCQLQKAIIWRLHYRIVSHLASKANYRVVVASDTVLSYLRLHITHPLGVSSMRDHLNGTWTSQFQASLGLKQQARITNPLGTWASGAMGTHCILLYGSITRFWGQFTITLQESSRQRSLVNIHNWKEQCISWKLEWLPLIQLYLFPGYETGKMQVWFKCSCEELVFFKV
jgi:hypothetical protein